MLYILLFVFLCFIIGAAKRWRNSMKMWIARNKDDILALFKTKPICINDGNNILYWAGKTLYLSPYDFPEITFENLPQEVELVIKKKDDTGG